MRVLGPKVGVPVIVLDVLKGTAAVLIAAQLGGVGAEALAGAAAVVGHTFPVFLRFRGGKAVATGAGAMLGLAPGIAVIVVILWIVFGLVTRYVSVASMLSAVAFVLLAIFDRPAVADRGVHAVRGRARVLAASHEHRARCETAPRGGLNLRGRAVMTALRAAVFTGVDRPLQLETLELDEPRAGEVAVRIEASGLCHSDLHVMLGEWSERPPMVLGHEGCGVVESVGEGVHQFAPGDRVVLCWYAPCGECARCREGRPWVCLNTRANSSLMPDGGTRLRRLTRRAGAVVPGGRLVRPARGGAGVGRGAGGRQAAGGAGRADRLRRRHRRRRGHEHGGRAAAARAWWS